MESMIEMQVRLVLEQQCADLAREIKARVPAGVCFTLILADVGEKGNLAYVSTMDRESSPPVLRSLASYIEAKR